MDCKEKNRVKPRLRLMYDLVGNLLGYENSSGEFIEQIPDPDEVIFDLLRIIHDSNPNAPFPNQQTVDGIRLSFMSQSQLNEPFI